MEPTALQFVDTETEAFATSVLVVVSIMPSLYPE